MASDLMATFKIGNRAEFSRRFANMDEAIKWLGQCQEKFGEKCGACGSSNTSVFFRDSKTRSGEAFSIVKLICLDCEAGIRLCKTREGRTFLGRNDTNKNPLPNKGWVKYEGRGQQSGGSSRSDDSGGDDVSDFF